LRLERPEEAGGSKVFPSVFRLPLSENNMKEQIS
jgi:hypothetical protein